MRDALRFEGIAKYVTVAREGDRWFASILVETPEPKELNQPRFAAGVDLGVKDFAVLSRPLNNEAKFKGVPRTAARHGFALRGFTPRSAMCARIICISFR
jgi:transposase